VQEATSLFARSQHIVRRKLQGVRGLTVEIQRGARGKFVVTNLYMSPIREGGQVGFNPGAIRVPAAQHHLGGDFNAHFPPLG
jgi:hypothetical protein